MACHAGAASVDDRVEELLQRMSLEEKIDMISGTNDFYIRGNKRLGLPELKMTDGPVGTRNDGPTTAYPAGIALAATWDTDLAQREGEALGRDARARGDHFLLGPGLNIQRVPQGGRNFEYFGEDPYLASRIAVGYVRGIQSQGVAATAKHFAANNHENDRNNDSSEVDERTLNEIYFPAFRAAVQEGGAKAVMCSYNLINGIHASADDWLLNQVLKKQWGFSGLVMSDWGAVHETLGCVNGGLDLEMPSGEFINRATVLPLLKADKISQATIDDKVRRILRVAVEMGWLDRPQLDASIPRDDPQDGKVALDVARAGIVLLKNEKNLLPLVRSKIKTIVVVGPNADPAVTGGGGSSHTRPFHAVSVLEGIRNKAGSGVSVIHIPAGKDSQYQEFFGNSKYLGPLRAMVFNSKNLTGPITQTRLDPQINFDWGDRDTFSTRWTGKIRPEKSGDYQFVLRSDDGSRFSIDGKSVIDMWSDHQVQLQKKLVHLEAGRTYDLQIDYYNVWGAAVMQFGWGPPQPLISADALKQIAQADAAIVCIGFNGHLETEGGDRSFQLPGDQDQIIAAVTQANPRTIVILNAGGSVDMTGWLDRVPALLDAWYPGQAGGTALAEIIFGEVNPSGKLPASFEKRWEDAAAYGNFPATNHKMVYREGIFVGYRHFDAKNIEPQFCFGYGLSYTAFRLDNLAAARTGSNVVVTADVTNTGPRPGAEVVQLYVGDKHPRVPRPVRELKAFQKIALQPGETKPIQLLVPPAAFSFYDTNTHDWVIAPGPFEIAVGDSSRNLPLHATITWP